MKRRSPVIVLIAMLATVIVPAALASPTETVRDEFRTIAYDGNDGSTAWVGPWDESDLVDDPDAGPIQVVASDQCAAGNCLRLGGDWMIGAFVFRTAAIPSGSQATLTFSYRRQSEGTGGDLRVKVAESLWSSDTLATIHMDVSDDAQVPASFDLSEWAGKEVSVVFEPFGDFTEGHVYIDNVQVAMTTPNADPAFTDELPDQSNVEGESVSLAVDAVDPDGHDLTYSASGLPSGVSVNSDTGGITGTVDYSASINSPYAVTITVTDGHGGSDQMSFSWQIIDNNRPPTMAAIADQSIDEGSTWSFAVHADDPDLPHDTLTYSLPAAPTGASINSTGRISWTPGESAGPGSYDFTVKVVDGGDPRAYATRSFTVEVAEVNAAPLLSPVSDQANGVGDVVSLQLVASDTDTPKNTLTFSASGLPPGVSINPGSGLISGTIPGTAPNSANEVTVKVRDNGSPALATTRSFTWQVTRDNHAPVLARIPEQSVAPESTLVFTASAGDVDAGDELSYWLESATDAVPVGASINANTGKFTWKPTEQQHGATYRITVGVTDSGTPQLSDSQIVVIAVPAINQAPVVTAPHDLESAEGDEIHLVVQAEDPDNTPGGLSFSVSGLPPGLAVDSKTGVIEGMVGYEAAEGSPYDITVTVTDRGEPSKSAVARFVWNIVDVNRPPTAETANYVAVIDEPLPIVLGGADPDGDALEYAITSPPAAGTLAGGGATFTYTTAGGAHADEFTFSVSDGEFGGEGVVRLEIRTTNNSPTAAPDAFDVQFGETLQVAAPGLLANDSDLDGDTLAVSLVSGPSDGQVILGGDGSFRYVPNEGFSGKDEFTYAVTDATGLTATARVIISVAAQPAVVADDGPRIDVLVSTTPLWNPVETSSESTVKEVSRAVVFALNSGISVVPGLSFPLLLLVIALLLGLTLGRISLVPVRISRNRRRGWVNSYDMIHGVGRLVPADGSDEIFVQANAVAADEPLVPGQAVEFVASELKGRRIAVKVWPSQ